MKKPFQMKNAHNRLKKTKIILILIDIYNLVDI